MAADENKGSGVGFPLSRGNEGVFLSSKKDEKDIHVGRGDAGDAAGLADGLGADARKFLSGLDGELLQLVVVDRLGKSDGFETGDLLSHCLLAADISLVLDLHFGSLDDLVATVVGQRGKKLRKFGYVLGQKLEVQFGTIDQGEQFAALL